MRSIVRGGPSSRAPVVAVSASQAQMPPPQRPTPTGRITPSNQPPPPPGAGPYQQQQPGQPYGMPPQYPPPQQPFNNPPPPPNSARDVLNNYAKALIAGAFVCGLGVGVRGVEGESWARDACTLACMCAAAFCPAATSRGQVPYMGSSSCATRPLHSSAL